MSRGRQGGLFAATTELVITVISCYEKERTRKRRLSERAVRFPGLSSVMIYIDKNLKSPLYQQVYTAIKMEVILKIRKEGEKLPSIRALAKELSVSATTIVQAYEQLSAEGYVENRRGSGHYVCKVEAPQPGSDVHVQIHEFQPVPEKKCLYRLEYGQVDRRNIPIKKFKKVIDRSLLDIEPSRYASYEKKDGLAALQGNLSYYLNISRGVVCEPFQVLIASSSHQLLEIAVKMLKYRRSITSVAVEDPGSAWYPMVFHGNDFQVTPVSETSQGMDLKELKKTSARVVCVTPSHQFPTGSFMPVQQRLELLSIMKKRDGFIIEDGSTSELRYRSMSIPALQGLDDSDRVFYIGSASKVFAPGLRISYMVIPKSFREDFDTLFESFHGNVPDFLQRAFYYFMEEGYWENHIKKITNIYSRKHDRFIRVLEEKLSPDCTLIGTGGGLSFVVQSENGLTEEEMIARAREESVEVFPVSPYWIRKEKYGNNQVLLGFVSLTDEEQDDVAQRLSRAWHISN